MLCTLRLVTTESEVVVSDRQDADIQQFLESEKAISKRIRWKTRGRQDYADASAVIYDRATGRRRAARLIITSHRGREPHKFVVCLSFKGQRVLSLDVNPGRSHRNILTRASVRVTHWHRWPNAEIAEEDDRNLTFSQWLIEFMEAAKILCKYKVASPPRGIQLEFGKWLR